MGEEVKTRFIAIRNEALLRGDLKPMDKYLLMILENRKLFATKNDGWFDVKIRTKKLKDLSLISDGRTLLRSLNRLRKFGYINYQFEICEKSGKEKLSNINKMLIKIDCNPPFTLVDEEMFDKLRNLNTGESRPHQITVLYYILEHYHNPLHGGEQGVASPNREMLEKSLKIDTRKITKFFKLMHDNYMCEFMQGKFYTDNQRSRNRYLPNTIKNKSNESDVGMNMRRYIRHKKPEYFKLPMDDK